MPPVIVPVALAAATGAAGVYFTGATIGAALLNVGATALAAGYSYLTQPKPPGEAAVAAPANEQRNVPIAQSTPPRLMPFGNVRTGGVLFFQDNVNPYLAIGTTFGDGRILSVDTVFVGSTEIACDGDGDAVEGTPFHDRFSFEWSDGADDQAASPTLLDLFPDTIDSSFQQRGSSRAVATLHWGADATEHNSLWGDGLNPSYQLRGLLVYDPRDGTQDIDDKDTWQYSDNVALCVAYALTHCWNLALPHSAINWASVATAADVCDTTVNYQGADVPLFRCAGIVQSGADIGSQIMDMLQAMRGRITFHNGKYCLLADEARSSVWTIRDADVLEIGDFAFGAETRARFNATSASFFNAGDAGQKTTTQAYQLTSAIATEGLRETSVALKFVPTNYQAQIIAFRELMDSRDGRGAIVRLTDAALFLAPGDVVSLNLVSASFINGRYTVEQIELEDVGATIVLKGYSPEVYADPALYLI